MSFIAVYITYPNMDEARKVVGRLLKKRLIACANLFPVESMYWWEGREEEALEIVSVVKARRKDWKKLVAEVERIHPYETPCIVRYDVKANASYERWVKAETG